MDVFLAESSNSFTFAIFPLTTVLWSISTSLQTVSVPASIFHIAFIDGLGNPSFHLDHTTDYFAEHIFRLITGLDKGAFEWKLRIWRCENSFAIATTMTIITPVCAKARYHLDTVAMFLVLQPCACVREVSLALQFIVTSDCQNTMALALTVDKFTNVAPAIFSIIRAL